MNCCRALSKNVLNKRGRPASRIPCLMRKLWSPMSMDEQSCHFSSFYAILYFSNHLLVLATSCIMYNLVPTPHSIPDYILITSAGTPGWLPVLGSQPADDAPPVITTTTAPICCFQHIIHRIVTLYTGYWIHSTAGAGTQSTVTSASQRRRRRQKYLLCEHSSPRLAAT